MIRKNRKTTGLGRIIEGEITDAPIVLVDDILHSGKSAEKACAAIEGIGKSIEAFFAVVDYEAKAGLRWRERKGIEVRSLFTLRDFGLTLENNPPPPQQLSGRAPSIRLSPMADIWRQRSSLNSPVGSDQANARRDDDDGVFLRIVASLKIFSCNLT